MSPTFALAADRDPATFLGGVIATPTGDVDLLKALEDGNGTIVADDPRVIAVLDNHRALQRVDEDAAPAPAEPPAAAAELADANTRDALNALALEHGVEAPELVGNKLELATLIVAAQAAQPVNPQQDDQAGDAGADS